MSRPLILKIIYFLLAALSLFILGSRITAGDAGIFSLLVPAAIVGFCTWRLFTLED
ncbi:hypothetical protein [Longibacter salinarum]|uniref:hypothetical protein n=1 Tax=Longibacter salinarum TaxID=1850348 RepID=UPI0015CF3C14|nr:hypothetical protein [Longibacter salinarum]